MKIFIKNLHNFALMLVPGPKRIQGNKMADQLAREGNK